MANDTMLKFGYPETLIHEYDHWVVLLRPAQVTLGSLILAAKSEAIAFGDLPAGAHAELATVTKDIESVLGTEIGYQKINYLMLMMVDPHVHFHVLPRYEGERSYGELAFMDRGWPGQPDLQSAIKLSAEDTTILKGWISSKWNSAN